MRLTNNLKRIIAEISRSPIYGEFITFLRKWGIETICDFHAHTSSGREDFVPTASPQDRAELPWSPFSVADIGEFYDALLETAGIKTKIIVFDTPLIAYNLTQKNRYLLDEVARMDITSPGRVIPFAIVTPQMGRAEIEDYVAKGAQGFKISPRTAPAYYSGEKRTLSRVTLSEMLARELLEIANTYGLPILIHLPEPIASARINQGIKDSLAEITADYPEIKVVLAHLGSSHTMSRVEDILGWIEKNNLEERIYLDISTITESPVLEIAFSSRTRLLFGTDMDFSLVERGRYLVVTPAGELLAREANFPGTPVLVSTSFGSQYRKLALQQGIPVDLPLFLVQLEAILEATKSRSPQEKVTEVLTALFFRNGESLLNRVT